MTEQYISRKEFEKYIYIIIQNEMKEINDKNEENHKQINQINKTIENKDAKINGKLN